MTQKIKTRALFFLAVIVVIIFFCVRPYYNLISSIVGVSPARILLTSGSYKKNDDRVNIVLLGKAGGNHDGPNLTDSIVVASYNLKTNSATLISIPRDIWSGTLHDKINSAYAYGEAKKKGGGMILGKAEVGAIVGLPIHYAVLIDFDKFKTLIDYFGGIDITVDRSFDDLKFPITGRENDECGGDPEYLCRYEHISFKQGLQHMDGNTALKYVRSRYAIGEEGTDFARNKRQEKILKALSERILMTIKKGNIDTIKNMYSQLDAIISRDITNPEAAYIGKNILLKKSFNLTQFALSEDLFTVPRKSDYLGKYVLIPTSGSFNSIHEHIACILKTNSVTQCQ